MTTKLNKNYFQMSLDTHKDLTDNQYQQDDKAQRLVRNKLNLFLDPETRVAHVKATVTCY